MENTTQLLCTFTSVDTLDSTIELIDKVYILAFNKIYVLENIDDTNQLVLTYNVSRKHTDILTPPPSTISVH
jgi:hypothetical protein